MQYIASEMRQVQPTLFNLVTYRIRQELKVRQEDGTLSASSVQEAGKRKKWRLQVQNIYQK